MVILPNIQTCLRPLANGLWYLLAWPESVAFHRAGRDVAGTQQKLLLKLLRRNAETDFGRRYDFATISSVAEYQARLPLSTYDDYQAAIDQIGAGRPRVLTRDPVLLLEPTSGSTAATKYIPYTAALKAEFQRAIAPWVVNLFGHHPSLLLGQAYWSVTPVTRRNERTSGGLPIGFEEDSEYFGGLQRHLIQAVLAVPPLVRLIDDMETFRYVTLLFLLRSRALTLISIWNPTFLILLVERLSAWWPQLTADIAGGTLSLPTPLAADLQARFKRLNRPDPGRAAEIKTAFQSKNNPGSLHARLWPRLRLISCWTEAQAALYLPRLARLFPQARLQSKGLIATEGFVSLPLTGGTLPQVAAVSNADGHQPPFIPGSSALAIRSHFFEFIPTDDNQAGLVDAPPKLAHELIPGRQYAVVITTGGGLYRYQLHDVVEVVGHLHTCPLLRFVGKAAYISDWFGEKLNEGHVRRVLAELFNGHRLQPDFAMLACDEQSGRYAYTLFIEVSEAPETRLRSLATELEARLQENYHYRYCRDLGQLDPVRLFRIDCGALETYLAVCQTHGQRAGDIKPVALHRLGGWSGAFRGRIVG